MRAITALAVFAVAASGLILLLRVQSSTAALDRERRLLNAPTAARSEVSELAEPQAAGGPSAGEVSAGELPAGEAPAVQPVGAASANALLELQHVWDWSSMAKEMLQPFTVFTREMLDAAVATCFDNGTMYCARAQVHRGSLYLTDYRAIFFDRWYAPARVMPLLDALRWHSLPDIDIVFAAVDEPRVKMLSDEAQWTRTVGKYPGKVAGAVKLPPPIFSSTVNRAHHDLPWPDFSFYTPRKEHKLRTPPWSELHGKMLRQSEGVRWEDKIELAMHTGNVGSPFRKRLAAAAAAHPDSMLVNELFIGDHGKIKQTCRELGLHTQGGHQQHKCFMRFEDQCSYKYLLNSASIGYANKFKYLLLCGSVVIYVQDGMQHKEFYEYGLLPGVHYVQAATADDVPAMVRYLREHDSYARAVASAGRARLAALDVRAIAAFNAELFTQYAAKQRFRVRPLPGAVRIDCEDDLWRHYARDPGFLKHFRSEDNATCVRPISPPFRPPGWGGAYNGSKVRCVASHDQRAGAQPLFCTPGAVVEEDQNPGDKTLQHRVITTTRSVQPGTSYAPFSEFPSAAKDGIPWTML